MRFHRKHLWHCNLQFVPQLCIQPEGGLQSQNVADDELLIKLCLDLFFVSFINNLYLIC